MPVIFIILAVGMSLIVLGVILYVIIRSKKEDQSQDDLKSDDGDKKNGG